jgi:hypothetical protein
VDQNFLKDSHPIIEEVQVPSPRTLPQSKNLVSLFLLSLALPLSVFAALTSQRFSASAAKPPVIITTVSINPGIIKVAPNSPPIQMSALAYDQNGRPIHGKSVTSIIYEWGISSTGSIARLETNNNIAIFYPLESGSGTLWVKAGNGSSKAMGSITVEISPSFPTPAPSPKVIKSR